MPTRRTTTPTTTTYSHTRRGTERSRRETLEAIAAQLSVLQEQVVAELEPQRPEPRAAALQARAKGTEDVTEAARQATGQMVALPRPARAKRATVAPDERQRHPSPIDDGIAPEELFELVSTLITDRPLTLQQLVEATGVRQNRISGALVHLDREHAGRLMRFPEPGAPGRRFRWFLAPAGASAPRR